MYFTFYYKNTLYDKNHNLKQYIKSDGHVILLIHPYSIIHVRMKYNINIKIVNMLYKIEKVGHEKLYPPLNSNKLCMTKNVYI